MTNKEMAILAYFYNVIAYCTNSHVITVYGSPWTAFGQLMDTVEKKIKIPEKEDFRKEIHQQFLKQRVDAWYYEVERAVEEILAGNEAGSLKDYVSLFITPEKGYREILMFLDSILKESRFTTLPENIEAT